MRQGRSADIKAAMASCRFAFWWITGCIQSKSQPVVVKST